MEIATGRPRYLQGTAGPLPEVAPAATRVPSAHRGSRGTLSQVHPPRHSRLYTALQCSLRASTSSAAAMSMAGSGHPAMPCVGASSNRSRLSRVLPSGHVGSSFLYTGAIHGPSRTLTRSTVAAAATAPGAGSTGGLPPPGTPEYDAYMREALLAQRRARYERQRAAAAAAASAASPAAPTPTTAHAEGAAPQLVPGLPQQQHVVGAVVVAPPLATAPQGPAGVPAGYQYSAAEGPPGDYQPNGLPYSYDTGAQQQPPAQYMHQAQWDTQPQAQEAYYQTQGYGEQWAPQGQEYMSTQMQQAQEPYHPPQPYGEQWTPQGQQYTPPQLQQAQEVYYQAQPQWTPQGQEYVPPQTQQAQGYGQQQGGWQPQEHAQQVPQAQWYAPTSQHSAPWQPTPQARAAQGGWAVNASSTGPKPPPPRTLKAMAAAAAAPATPPVHPAPSSPRSKATGSDRSQPRPASSSPKSGPQAPPSRPASAPGSLPSAASYTPGPRPVTASTPSPAASLPDLLPTTAPRPRRGTKPDGGLQLPNLLPTAKTRRGSSGSSGSSGMIVGSGRAGGARGDGGGGLVVGSTRSAKADFYEPEQMLERESRPAARSNGRSWRSGGPEAAATSAVNGGSGAGGVGGLLSGMGIEVSPAAPELLGALQSVSGAKPSAGGSAANGVSTGGQGTASGAAGGLSSSGQAAQAAPEAASQGQQSQAEVRRKARAVGPAWLSTFMQAGKAGAGAAGGVLTARGAAEGAGGRAAAKSADEVAAAMIRKAVERPARELDGAITDLPAPIASIQSRLERAVKAEQESELRALRALYAAGSLRRLQREGVVLVGLAAAQTGRLFRSTLWRFELLRPTGRSGPGQQGQGQQQQLPYHKFKAGVSVLITRHVPEGGGGGGGGGRKGGGGDVAVAVDEEAGAMPMDGVEGVVTEVHKDHLLIALEGRANDLFSALNEEALELTSRGAPGLGAKKGLAAAKGGGSSSSSTSGVGGGGAFAGWRLDQSVRDTTTRRHLDAVKRLGAWAESSAESRLGEARVRAVLAGSRSAPIIAAQPPDWVKEERWRADARAVLAAQAGLNDSQRQAVAAALTQTVTLWQGPPGTGKTRTLLALIEVLVRVRQRSPAPTAALMGPVLAVADTNAAVDNLVEGMAERGVRVVRLGPPAKTRESLRHLTLEAQSEATPLGRKAAAMRTRALEKQQMMQGALRSGSRGFAARGAEAVLMASQSAEVRSELEKAEKMLRQSAAEVLAAAQVVCATCTGAGDSLLDGRTWRCVVVDEASQATEPAVLVALTRGSAFTVLAGDPRQLPPTVLSEEAARQGLGVTLFERVAGSGVLPLLLDTQYRMHPAISAFPSAFFYGGRLRDGVAAEDKPIPKGFPWPSPTSPLALVSVSSGAEETSGGLAEMTAAAVAPAAAAATLVPRKGKGVATDAPAADGGGAAGKGGGGGADRASYRNPAEALLALAVTESLLAAGDISSAAILTPYRGQVRLLEAVLRQRGLDGRWAARGVEVAVSTVDGFQGREADVVVFSAVRSNSRRAVGFLSDPRRMNVAITRPRRGLVVLADTGTLAAGSRDWNTYIKWARSQGIVVDEDVVDVPEWLAGRGHGGARHRQGQGQGGRGEAGQSTAGGGARGGGFGAGVGGEAIEEVLADLDDEVEDEEQDEEEAEQQEEGIGADSTLAGRVGKGQQQQQQQEQQDMVIAATNAGAAEADGRKGLRRRRTTAAAAAAGAAGEEVAGAAPEKTPRTSGAEGEGAGPGRKVASSAPGAEEETPVRRRRRVTSAAAAAVAAEVLSSSEFESDVEQGAARRSGRSGEGTGRKSESGSLGDLLEVVGGPQEVVGEAGGSPEAPTGARSGRRAAGKAKGSARSTGDGGGEVSAVVASAAAGTAGAAGDGDAAPKRVRATRARSVTG